MTTMHQHDNFHLMRTLVQAAQSIAPGRLSTAEYRRAADHIAQQRTLGEFAARSTDEIKKSYLASLEWTNEKRDPLFLQGLHSLRNRRQSRWRAERAGRL